MEDLNVRKFLSCDRIITEKEKWEPGCWIHTEKPTEEDIKFLTEKIGIPNSFVSDIEDVDERPRIEEEDGWTLMILRIPVSNWEQDTPYITVPLGFVISKEHFITICHHSSDMIPDFQQYLQRKKISEQANWNLFLRMFISSSVWYMKYLKQINNRTRQVEVELEGAVQNSELQRLLKLEKSFVFFITSLRGNSGLLYKLKMERNRQNLDEDLLEDAEIELQQALDTARIYSDILNGTMDTFASVISNNLNIVMKRMTSVSLILMIPTLIASLYGMNVPNSLSANSWGFIIICSGSALLSVFIFLFLKKRKWF